MMMIPIDRLQPAMKLAADVKDRSGRLLASTGTELTTQHLLVFRTWGVKEVKISGLDADQGSAPESLSGLEINQQQLDEQIEKLKPFFRMCDTEHPFIRELMRLSALKGLHR